MSFMKNFNCLEEPGTSIASAENRETTKFSESAEKPDNELDAGSQSDDRIEKPSTESGEYCC